MPELTRYHLVLAYITEYSERISMPAAEIFQHNCIELNYYGEGVEDEHPDICVSRPEEF